MNAIGNYTFTLDYSIPAPGSLTLKDVETFNIEIITCDTTIFNTDSLKNMKMAKMVFLEDVKASFRRSSFEVTIPE